MGILIIVNNLFIFRHFLYFLSQVTTVLLISVSILVCYYYYMFLVSPQDNLCGTNDHNYKQYSFPFLYKWNKSHTSYLSKEQ